MKKDGIKIIIFFFNILLAAIAVFIIREKDEVRLLEKAQNENFGSGSAKGNALPSFENSVNVGDDISDNSGQTDAPNQTAPSDGTTVVPADPASQNVIPTAPEPVPNKKPPNAKTKTS